MNQKDLVLWCYHLNKKMQINFLHCLIEWWNIFNITLPVSKCFELQFLTLLGKRSLVLWGNNTWDLERDSFLSSHWQKEHRLRRSTSFINRSVYHRHIVSFSLMGKEYVSKIFYIFKNSLHRFWEWKIEMSFLCW